MTDSAHFPLVETETARMARQHAARLGVWSAALVAFAALAALVIALATAPPRSGPSCTLELVDVCIEFPYTDAVAYVPNDYLWMYPATLMALLFVILVICIHHTARTDRQVFSQVGVAFAAIAAATLIIDYFIQLTVMQPSFLKGEVGALTLWSQYNAHGLFIALENAGYLMMALAFLFIAPVFEWRDRLTRSLRLIFLVSAVVVVAALVLLALQYGSDLEYRFEVVAIVVDWLALIVAGGLLSLFFRRLGR